ncbi:MAG: ATP-dependent DNA ligase [Thermoprotei archaeon]|nr:MAG: ATP-dependent DNA ligase [Thermoprotei archaeon]
MDLQVLVQAFDKLESITSRTQMTLILVDLFRKTPASIIDKVIYLIQGKLWPDWKGLPELGVGEKFLVKAIAKATRVKESEVERLYKKFGDLGRAAEFLKQREAGGAGLMKFMAPTEALKKRLSVEGVYETLVKVALAAGEGSRDIKIGLIAGLLAEATPLEARYLMRFIEGRLRLGIGDATIMDALAITFAGSQSYRPLIERAYNIRADLANIAKVVAERGIKAIEGIKPEVGIPIRPMLAERLSDPSEILSKVGGKALIEYKYDGERAQIHKRGDEVWIFSRRLENITHQYPDVAEMTRQYLTSSETIVEGEVVAIDPDTREMKPFQELMHRKRKHDIHEALKEYPVAVFLFDVLYNEGEDLTFKPIAERREVLYKIVREGERFRIAEHMITDSPEELEKFFLRAIEDGAEGVMVKALHKQAIYQAGARGWLWIKYKRDYKSEMTDTVDLVVIGAFAGRGKRAGRYGALLVAAYDPSTDMFRSVCKVGSGFTDEDLEKLNDIISPYIIQHKHPRVDSLMKPDVWVSPALVAEIIGAELTLSPIHTCCRDLVKKGAGISIRFPRFIRWRDDKGPEDATTVDELLEMYKRQLRRVEETRPSAI